MSTIVGVFVGGAISLSTVWWIGPIVSRRQRTEQRREYALLELQGVAQLKLIQLSVHIKFLCDRIERESNTQGWREQAAVERDSLDEMFGADHQRITAELDRYFGTLQEVTDQLRDELLPVSTWINRVNDDELTIAYARVRVAMIGLGAVNYETDVLRRVDLAIEFGRVHFPPMESGVDLLAVRPLVMLGHTPPSADEIKG